MAASAEYILGSDDEELERLRFQHGVWREHTRRLLRRAGFSRGQTLLDVGCGPGFTTLDLRELAGAEGRVVGIDSSDRMVALLRAEAARREFANVAAARQDAGELRGIGKFDGAFARWLLCFLDEPGSVVRRIAGLLPRGGRLAVMDYFHYTAMTVQPRSAAFDRVAQAVFDSIGHTGGNLEIGRELPSLMESAGLQVESVEPICGIGRPGTGIWTWFAEFQRTYLPKVVAAGFLSQEERRDFERFWAEISSRPDAFLFPPPMIGVVGAKR